MTKPLGNATRCLVCGVWLLTLPAVVLLAVGSALAPPFMPFWMAAPLFVAISITFPILADRPGFPATTAASLFLVVLGGGAVVLLAVGHGTPGTLLRALASVALLLAAIAAVALPLFMLWAIWRHTRSKPLPDVEL